MKKNSIYIFIFLTLIAVILIICSVGIFIRGQAPAVTEPPAGTDSDFHTDPPTDPITDSPTEPATEPPATEPVTEPPETEPPVRTPEIDYTDLPAVLIDTGGVGVVSKTNYVACTVSVTEDGITSAASAQVRVRGNSSAYYGNEEKIAASGGHVPYKIKFDVKTNVLGMHDGKDFRDWVLLRADDESGTIGNDVTLRLGRAILRNEYCSDGRFVRLYLNGVDLGIYLFCEQNEVKKNRVNINEPDETSTDVLTGYYFEIENYLKGETLFLNKYASATVTDVEGVTRTFEPTNYSIKSQINTDEQRRFIGDYVNSVFQILYEAVENGRAFGFDGDYKLRELDGTAPGDAVAAVIDLDSAVDMYILYELVHDYDIGDGSFFMYVDLTPGLGDGKLHFTSPWDFDWICHGDSTGRFWASAFSEDWFYKKYGDRTNPWFVVLYKADWFRALVCERWGELRAANAIGAALEEERLVYSLYKKYGLGGSGIITWIEKRSGWLDTVWQA